MTIIDAMRGLFRQKTEPESAITKRFRIADEQDQLMAEQGMVPRPPNAETVPRGSDFINRRDTRLRDRDRQAALLVGHRPWFRATK